ncbi:MAG: hypothetical protein AM326_03870 [Candidatus Thorarchaeota archaeon SMTZ-45]|nr:MAG: hypothetical protein AM326_03870 [Candidatus Thorarchaeota archaeon SMTZ-45]
MVDISPLLSVLEFERVFAHSKQNVGSEPVNSLDQLNRLLFTMLSPIRKHARSHDRVPLALGIGWVEVSNLNITRKLAAETTMARTSITNTFKQLAAPPPRTPLGV